MPELRLSFEPADIVNEVMSFGSPTPIDVAVSGPNLADNRAYRARSFGEPGRDQPALRDLQFGQSLDYPTVEVRDRPREGGPQRRGTGGESRARWSRPRRRRGSSCRIIGPTQTGIGYQVQVRDSASQTTSIARTWKPCRSRRRNGKELLAAATWPT